MHHRMDIRGDKVEFTKTRLGGLVGAKAHILSQEMIDQFLSIKDGVSIADLLGFDLPLKVNLQNLVRYHSACLAFLLIHSAKVSQVRPFVRAHALYALTWARIH